MHRSRKFLAACAAAVVGFPLAVVTAAAGQAGASPAPITIAYISSLTGPAASQDGDSAAGFRARIAWQNAHGGVHGHKLVPLVIDDQTNPSQTPTAVKEAISKGAFGIVSQSPLFFEGAKYAQQAGIPVTGSYDDGPEWGTKPYTNMFASDNGSVDPKYPVNTLIASFVKAHGGTNMGAYGYGISPSSSRAAIGVARAFKHVGGKVGVLDTSVPFGSVAFQSTALTAHQNGVNSLVPALDGNSNYALTEALEQAGVKLKVAVFATGYGPQVIHSAAWKSLQGTYFLSLFRPWSLPNAGTQQMKQAMQRYAGFTSTQFPDFGQYEAWAGADLMILGLQLAGPNPTRAEVIKKLRGVKAYNVNGLLPQTLDYSTIFGHDPPLECGWMMRAGPNGFTAVSPNPTCGRDLPGTTTVSGSSTPGL